MPIVIIIIIVFVIVFVIVIPQIYPLGSNPLNTSTV
jgi:hypothetical protein